MKKTNLITYLIFAFFCVSFLAFLVFNPSHAYFQLFMKDAAGVNSTKVDLLFDKFDSNGTYGEFEVNLDTGTWGTPQNPYVINAPNHVSNLSVLQRSGYFAKKVDSDGNPRQSYFVVCTPTGYPVAIDCDGMEIAPVGSPVTPFTGVVKGAPIKIEEYTGTGTPYDGTEYTNVYKTPDDKDLATTQSAITNLIVAATDATPDIGFFGRLGYNGTVTQGTAATETANATPDVLSGYAAQIGNLLFADVTITTEQSIISETTTWLSDWWASFGTRAEKNSSGTEVSVPVDKVHDACGETHHVGIIAGHAEWATITNISVYYSENVSAFVLDSSKDDNEKTNYYSVVALFGTVDRINPTYTTLENGTVTIDSTNSVSDKDLSDEIITGGGGGESGMLTGYMLSQNIYNRNDNTSAERNDIEVSYEQVYDVKDLYENVYNQNGNITSTNSIFEHVDVTEKTGGWLGTGIGATSTKYRYYFFRDSIFTFAMSARGKVTGDTVDDGDGKVDLLVQIWKTTDDASTITITDSLTVDKPDVDTDNTNAWHQVDLAGKQQNLYQLIAIDPNATDANDPAKFNENDQYIIAYRAEDGTIYTFDPSKSSAGYVNSFTISPLEVATADGDIVPRVPTYFEDGSNGYILYDINNNDLGYRAPKITFEDEEIWQQPSGYILYKVEGNTTTIPTGATPMGYQTASGVCLYFNLTDGLYETSYVDNSGKLQTLTYSAGSITEDGKAYTIIPVKVYLGLKGFYVVGNDSYTTTNSTKYYFSMALKNVAGRPLTKVDDTPDANDSFGLTATGQYTNPSWTVSSKESNTSGYQTAYWFAWTLSSVSTSIQNTFSVTGRATFARGLGILVNREYSYHNTAILFDTSNKNFSPEVVSHGTYDGGLSNDEISALEKPTPDAGESATLLLFKVVNPGEPEIIPGKDWEIKEPLVSFNASTHVLFYDGELDENGNRKADTYTITPIENLKWNNGKGEYLKSLNHAIKLAEATRENTQLNFKNLFGDNWFGNLASSILDSNTGGVVPAPIGTSTTSYTIPSGMIAFDILKASAAEPSYINLIVAVNPNQMDPSWIGLYKMEEGEWNSTFSLKDHAAQRLHLPLSVMGTYESYLEKYKTTISGYYSGEKLINNTNYYTYLGGDVVFVAYSFKVTEPSIYLLGSSSGPMTVAYFSVDGAAGVGGDGTGGSPLGDVDFVYDNGTDILTVDNKFEGSHIVEDEDPTQFYYPSYYYVRLMPNVSSSTKIPSEDLKIRRYITETLATGTDRRRYIKITKTQDGTVYVGLLDMYEDNLDPNSTGAPTS